jgi:hypothetical protein
MRYGGGLDDAKPESRNLAYRNFLCSDSRRAGAATGKEDGTLACIQRRRGLTRKDIKGGVVEISLKRMQRSGSNE